MCQYCFEERALCQCQACGNETASAMGKQAPLRKQEALRGLSHLRGYELFQFARYLRWIVGFLNEESLRG
jgi:hypothetical protein